MLIKTINNWFNHAKNYFFTNKEGFHELSFVANSPTSIVASIAAMPFVKHNKAEQYFTINNPYAGGNLHYQELEEGLWLVYSEAVYKASVMFKPFFSDDLPREHYVLIYNIDKNELRPKATLFNYNIEIANHSWVFFKPEATVDMAHFNHTNRKSITLYFTKEWLYKNLWNDKVFIETKFSEFFTGDAQHIILADNELLPLALFPVIQKEVFEKGSQGMANILKVKSLIFNFIETFIKKYGREKNTPAQIEISNNDRVRIAKAENYLTNNLLQKFEGIDELASRFKISPTKLKNDFKLIYGKPVFQYYQEKQMQLAGEILKKEDIRIKELAARMGYENIGKFSLAFKKYYDILPSQFLKQETD